MKILALESYYGGSHKAFLDGWQQHSEHEFTLLTLPANKWKWRMRHSAITFAQQVNALLSSCHSREGGNPEPQLPWDILFCSDMLNLAEFCGLADASVRRLPKIVYFHENQLTYPVRVESERDYQYAVTNITTALAADAVWFNSDFHRREFLEAIERFLKRMPDHQPLEVIEVIRRKSSIQPPGISPITLKRQQHPGPPRILWAARWEHDKNPEDFFEAMKQLKQQGADFRLNVIGEQFREYPEVFDWAKIYFADHIDRWGYQPSRADYETALSESDIVVSTANHEFFGIGVLEAVAAGCLPVLPDRLSYPHILQHLAPAAYTDYLYDGTVAGLVKMLEKRLQDGLSTRFRPDITAFTWPRRAKQIDAAMANFSA